MQWGALEDEAWYARIQNDFGSDAGLLLIRRQYELRKSAKAEELMETLIMFDFDGRLADTLGVFIESFDALADGFGFRRFGREQMGYLRTCEAVETLRHHGINLSEARPVIAALRDEMEKRSEPIKLFEGIASLLRALVAGKRETALITSNSEGLSTRTLGPDLLRTFRFCEFDVGISQKADAIKHVLNQSGVCEKALYVGDEIRDVYAARDASVNFAGVGWGYNTPESLLSAGCPF